MARTRTTGKHWLAALALLQPLAALPQPMPLGYCWPEGWTSGWQMLGGGAGSGWMFPLAMFGLMVLVVAFTVLLARRS